MLARAVFPLHGFGGIERHVFHLVTHLSDLGVELDLFVQDAPANAPTTGYAIERLMHNPLIRVHTLRYDRTSPALRPNSIIGRQINYPIFTLQEARNVAPLVRSDVIDVVHTQGLCALGWALLRQRDQALCHVPMFANPHGMEEYKSRDWRKHIAYAPFRAQYSWAHRHADYAIATDACTWDDLPRYLGVNPAKIVVLPSAIDLRESETYTNQTIVHDLRQRFGRDQHELIMLTVSRLERNKGYHHLLDALAQLRPELPATWRVLMVGTGKEQANLQAQIERLDLANHVTLVGKLSDAELHSLYEIVDLFVHPTLYEGSSLVTLEAMSHRLPVVATAAGGIPDKVFTGRNGVLVQPDDRNSLVNGLRLALQLRDHWRAWGDAGYTIVAQTFDWRVVARQTLNSYEQALKMTKRS